MSARASIFVVEDDIDVRARLAEAIHADDSLELMSEAGDLHSARTTLARHLPDIALIDLGLPDGDGTQLIRWLDAQDKEVNSLVLTMFGDEKHVVAAIEAGATGYLLKDDSLANISEQLHVVRKGGSPVSPAVARHILRKARQGEKTQPSKEAPALTPTELDILRFIAKGYSAPEIARKMDRSESTVPVHIKNIYRKLAVHSRGEAVFEALQLGLIKPPS